MFFLIQYDIQEKMVGTTGIEPVTTAMSRQCSTAELRAPKITKPDKSHQGRARYHTHTTVLNYCDLTSHAIKSKKNLSDGPAHGHNELKKSNR